MQVTGDNLWTVAKDRSIVADGVLKGSQRFQIFHVANMLAHKTRTLAASGKRYS